MGDMASFWNLVVEIENLERTNEIELVINEEKVLNIRIFPSCIRVIEKFFDCDEEKLSNEIELAVYEQISFEYRNFTSCIRIILQCFSILKSYSPIL